MALRIQPIQVAVQHVRQPRQRMPIPGISSGESPDDTFSGESCLHIAVFHNVCMVVVGDEIVVSRLPIDRNSRHDQNQNDYITMIRINSRIHCGEMEAGQAISYYHDRPNRPSRVAPDEDVMDWARVPLTLGTRVFTIPVSYLYRPYHL